MKINKGLFQDIRPHDQPEGTYRFGKNGIQDHTKQAVENEPGHNIDPATLPYPLNGVIEVDHSRAVLFLTDNTTSSIGYYDRITNTYTKIIDDTDLTEPLGFSLDFWITGEFQRNFKDEVIVAFTNKRDFPKILNCDVPGVTSPQQMRMFLQSQTPTITAAATTGGLLDKGSYFIGIRYLLNDGSETDVVTFSSAIPVSSSDPGPISDKAIDITISNIDQNFDKIQLIFVSRVNGAYRAFEGPELQITPTSIHYVYTGEEILTEITMEEVVVPSANYVKVGTIGQLNDALYIADLESDPDLNLQKYANLVTVRVKSELVNAMADSPDPQKRGLMHQEVYALYIRYHKTSGTWTKFFHIPGNAPISADLLAASASVHETDMGAKVYQTEDTNRNVNTLTNTVDTGIWVNEDETYPNLPAFDSSGIGGTDLRGLVVRHHRMPSIAFTKDNFYSSETSYGKDHLDVLSLEISNVTLPPDIATEIDGYEIGIAKRTVNNSLVLGQSILLLSAQPKPYANTSLNAASTGGNFHSMTIDTAGSSSWGNFTDTKAMWLTGRTLSGIFGTGTQTPVEGLRFRFHSFDVLFNRPAIAPSYMSPQLFMRVDGLASESSGYLEDGELGGARVPIMWIADYTDASRATTPTSVVAAKRVRVIESDRYVANNGNTGEWNNTDLETVYAGKMKWIGTSAGDNDLPLNVPFSTANKADNQRPSQRPDFEETYLMNLMDIKANIYDAFYNQTVLASGQFVSISTPVAQVYCGDIYVSEYTFHTYGWFDGENHPGDGATNPETDGGYKIVHRFVCEAVSDINLRYEVDGNIYSRWWPHNTLTAQPSSPDGYLYAFNRAIDPNQFGYSSDLNAFADFLSLVPFNPYSDDVFQFPYRIHRGGKLPRQGKIRSWRKFLALDYYEMQKNMGRIIRVVGLADHLLIHTENALFRTQDKVKLETDLLSIVLGTGDIFQFEPQEALPTKQGFAGTQHELAAVVTPLGYVFVDAKQGEIYLFRDGVKLINQGMSIFLKEALRIEGKNVFIGNGITIGYDPDFKRILVTVKNQTLVTNLENFVPGYEATQAFIDTLEEGVSIVYKDGRYQLFEGLNDTEFECPGTNHAPLTSCNPGVDGNCTCPPGSTIAPDGSSCQEITSISATPPDGGPGTEGIVAKVSNAQWNNGGGIVWAPGYSIGGTGAESALLTTPHLWVNGAALFSPGTRNTIDSRMNAAGIWAASPVPDLEYIGFSRKIHLTNAKTVYIGMSADNAFRFKVNGVAIVDMSTGSLTSPTYGGPGANFNFWNVYPVNLVAGDNFIEMTAVNFGSVAGMAAEIYDCTLAQLTAVTSIPELEAYIIFSTKDLVGQPFEIGETAGWSCPAGYALDTTTDPYTCKQVTELPFDCTTAATTEENGPVGTVLVNVASLFSDPDSDALSYSITSGNTDNAFYLDPITGDLKINNVVDYDTIPFYVLTIRATDPSGAYVECTRGILITNGNFAPDAVDQSFSICDAAVNGTVVGTVVATQVEGEAITFAWASGTPPFDIDATTGVITKNGALDAGVTAVYALDVLITDTVNSLTTTITVTINVLDCAPTKNVFLVNSSGVAITIDIDGTSYVFPASTNGNVVVTGGGVLTNNTASSRTFEFLTSMPSTDDGDEAPNPDTLATSGTHTFNADLTNLNYIKVT